MNFKTNNYLTYPFKIGTKVAYHRWPIFIGTVTNILNNCLIEVEFDDTAKNIYYEEDELIVI